MFSCRSVFISSAWTRSVRHWLRYFMNGDPVTCLNCLLFGANAPKFFLDERIYPTHEMLHGRSDNQHLPCITI